MLAGPGPSTGEVNASQNVQHDYEQHSDIEMLIRLSRMNPRQVIKMMQIMRQCLIILVMNYNCIF